MRKLLVAAVVSALVVGAVASAEAGKKKAPKKTSRVAEASYVAPARFYWAPTGDNIGGATFATGAGESYVTVTIEDALGQDVSAALGQDPEGDNTVSIIEDFLHEHRGAGRDPGRPRGPGLRVRRSVHVAGARSRVRDAGQDRRDVLEHPLGRSRRRKLPGSVALRPLLSSSSRFGGGRIPVVRGGCPAHPANPEEEQRTHPQGAST